MRKKGGCELGSCLLVNMSEAEQEWTLGSRGKVKPNFRRWI